MRTPSIYDIASALYPLEWYENYAIQAETTCGASLDNVRKRCQSSVISRILKGDHHFLKVALPTEDALTVTVAAVSRYYRESDTPQNRVYADEGAVRSSVQNHVCTREYFTQHCSTLRSSNIGFTISDLYISTITKVRAEYEEKRLPVKIRHIVEAFLNLDLGAGLNFTKLAKIYRSQELSSWLKLRFQGIDSGPLDPSPQLIDYLLERGEFTEQYMQTRVVRNDEHVPYNNLFSRVGSVIHSAGLLGKPCRHYSDSRIYSVEYAYYYAIKNADISLMGYLQTLTQTGKIGLSSEQWQRVYHQAIASDQFDKLATYCRFDLVDISGRLSALGVWVSLIGLKDNSIRHLENVVKNVIGDGQNKEIYSARDSNGNTLLHLAMQVAPRQVVEIYSKNKSAITVKNKSGWLPYEHPDAVWSCLIRRRSYHFEGIFENEKQAWSVILDCVNKMDNKTLRSWFYALGPHRERPLLNCLATDGKNHEIFELVFNSLTQHEQMAALKSGPYSLLSHFVVTAYPDENSVKIVKFLLNKGANSDDVLPVAIERGCIDRSLLTALFSGYKKDINAFIEREGQYRSRVKTTLMHLSVSVFMERLHNEGRAQIQNEYDQWCILIDLLLEHSADVSLQFDDPFSGNPASQVRVAAPFIPSTRSTKNYLSVIYDEFIGFIKYSVSWPDLERFLQQRNKTWLRIIDPNTSMDVLQTLLARKDGKALIKGLLTHSVYKDYVADEFLSSHESGKGSIASGHRDRYLRSKSLRHPLLCAVLSKDIDIYHLLAGLTKDRGSLNVVDYEGNTALHLAVLLGDQAMIEAVVKSGVDQTIKNSKGQSASELNVGFLKDNKLKKMFSSFESIISRCNDELEKVHPASSLISSADKQRVIDSIESLKKSMQVLVSHDVKIVADAQALYEQCSLFSSEILAEEREAAEVFFFLMKYISGTSYGVVWQREFVQSDASLNEHLKRKYNWLVTDESRRELILGELRCQEEWQSASEAERFVDKIKWLMMFLSPERISDYLGKDIVLSFQLASFVALSSMNYFVSIKLPIDYERFNACFLSSPILTDRQVSDDVRQGKLNFGAKSAEIYREALEQFHDKILSTNDGRADVFANYIMQEKDRNSLRSYELVDYHSILDVGLNKKNQSVSDVAQQLSQYTVLGRKVPALFWGETQAMFQSGSVLGSALNNRVSLFKLYDVMCKFFKQDYPELMSVLNFIQAGEHTRDIELETGYLEYSNSACAVSMEALCQANKYLCGKYEEVYELFRDVLSSKYEKVNKKYQQVLSLIDQGKYRLKLIKLINESWPSYVTIDLLDRALFGRQVRLLSSLDDVVNQVMTEGKKGYDKFLELERWLNVTDTSCSEAMCSKIDPLVCRSLDEIMQWIKDRLNIILTRFKQLPDEAKWGITAQSRQIIDEIDALAFDMRAHAIPLGNLPNDSLHAHHARVTSRYDKLCHWRVALASLESNIEKIDDKLKEDASSVALQQAELAAKEALAKEHVARCQHVEEMIGRCNQLVEQLNHLLDNNCLEDDNVCQRMDSLSDYISKRVFSRSRNKASKLLALSCPNLKKRNQSDLRVMSMDMSDAMRLIEGSIEYLNKNIIERDCIKRLRDDLSHLKAGYQDAISDKMMMKLDNAIKQLTTSVDAPICRWHLKYPTEAQNSSEISKKSTRLVAELTADISTEVVEFHRDQVNHSLALLYSRNSCNASVKEIQLSANERMSRTGELDRFFVWQTDELGSDRVDLARKPIDDQLTQDVLSQYVDYCQYVCRQIQMATNRANSEKKDHDESRIKAVESLCRQCDMSIQIINGQRVVFEDAVGEQLIVQLDAIRSDVGRESIGGFKKSGKTALYAIKFVEKKCRKASRSLDNIVEDVEALSSRLTSLEQQSSQKILQYNQTCKQLFSAINECDEAISDLNEALKQSGIQTNLSESLNALHDLLFGSSMLSWGKSKPSHLACFKERQGDLIEENYKRGSDEEVSSHIIVTKDLTQKIAAEKERIVICLKKKAVLIKTCQEYKAAAKTYQSWQAPLDVIEQHECAMAFKGYARLASESLAGVKMDALPSYPDEQAKHDFNTIMTKMLSSLIEHVVNGHLQMISAIYSSERDDFCFALRQMVGCDGVGTSPVKINRIDCKLYDLQCEITRTLVKVESIIEKEKLVKAEYDKALSGELDRLTESCRQKSREINILLQANECNMDDFRDNLSSLRGILHVQVSHKPFSMEYMLSFHFDERFYDSLRDVLGLHQTVERAREMLSEFDRLIVKIKNAIAMQAQQKQENKAAFESEIQPLLDKLNELLPPLHEKSTKPAMKEWLKSLSSVSNLQHKIEKGKVCSIYVSTDQQHKMTCEDRQMMVSFIGALDQQAHGIIDGASEYEEAVNRLAVLALSCDNDIVALNRLLSKGKVHTSLSDMMNECRHVLGCQEGVFHNGKSSESRLSPFHFTQKDYLRKKGVNAYQQVQSDQEKLEALANCIQRERSDIQSVLSASETLKMNVDQYTRDMSSYSDQVRGHQLEKDKVDRIVERFASYTEILTRVIIADNKDEFAKSDNESRQCLEELHGIMDQRQVFLQQEALQQERIIKEEQLTRYVEENINPLLDDMKTKGIDRVVDSCSRFRLTVGCVNRAFDAVCFGSLSEKTASDMADIMSDATALRDALIAEISRYDGQQAAKRVETITALLDKCNECNGKIDQINGVIQEGSYFSDQLVGQVGQLQMNILKESRMIPSVNTPVSRLERITISKEYCQKEYSNIDDVVVLTDDVNALIVAIDQHKIEIESAQQIKAESEAAEQAKVFKEIASGIDAFNEKLASIDNGIGDSQDSFVTNNVLPILDQVRQYFQCKQSMLEPLTPGKTWRFHNKKMTLEAAVEKLTLIDVVISQLEKERGDRVQKVKSDNREYTDCKKAIQSLWQASSDLEKVQQHIVSNMDEKHKKIIQQLRSDKSPVLSSLLRVSEELECCCKTLTDVLKFSAEIVLVRENMAVKTVDVGRISSRTDALTRALVSAENALSIKAQNNTELEEYANTLVACYQDLVDAHDQMIEEIRHVKQDCGEYFKEIQTILSQLPSMPSELSQKNDKFLTVDREAMDLSGLHAHRDLLKKHLDSLKGIMAIQVAAQADADNIAQAKVTIGSMQQSIASLLAELEAVDPEGVPELHEQSAGIYASYPTDEKDFAGFSSMCQALTVFDEKLRNKKFTVDNALNNCAENISDEAAKIDVQLVELGDVPLLKTEYLDSVYEDSSSMSLAGAQQYLSALIKFSSRLSEKVEEKKRLDAKKSASLVAEEKAAAASKVQSVTALEKLIHDVNTSVTHLNDCLKSSDDIKLPEDLASRYDVVRKRIEPQKPGLFDFFSASSKKSASHVMQPIVYDAKILLGADLCTVNEMSQKLNTLAVELTSTLAEATFQRQIKERIALLQGERLSGSELNTLERFNGRHCASLGEHEMLLKAIDKFSCQVNARLEIEKQRCDVREIRSAIKELGKKLADKFEKDSDSYRAVKNISGEFSQLIPRDMPLKQYKALYANLKAVEQSSSQEMATPRRAFSDEASVSSDSSALSAAGPRGDRKRFHAMIKLISSALDIFYDNTLHCDAYSAEHDFFECFRELTMRTCDNTSWTNNSASNKKKIIAFNKEVMAIFLQAGEVHLPSKSDSSNILLSLFKSSSQPQQNQHFQAATLTEVAKLKIDYCRAYYDLAQDIGDTQGAEAASMALPSTFLSSVVP
jgi:hypothetical protein